MLLGLGIGMFQSPNNSFIFGSVPREQYGVASGFIATMRTAGSSLGITLWGTIVTSRLTSEGFGGSLQAAVSNPAIRGEVTPVFLHGAHLAMYGGMAVVFVGILASALRGPQPKEAPAGAPALAASGDEPGSGYGMAGRGAAVASGGRPAAPRQGTMAASAQTVVPFVGAGRPRSRGGWATGKVVEQNGSEREWK